MLQVDSLPTELSGKLLLLSHFSCVRLCVTPWKAAHQAPLSLGFSSKNTGVGCHFLLQCMKVKSESAVAQLCPTLSDSMDCSLPGSSVHGIFQARVLEWGATAFSIHLLECPKSRRLTAPKAGEIVELKELLFIAGGNAK